MCESCSSRDIGRREFLAVSGVLRTAGVLSPAAAGEPDAAAQAAPQRDKQPAKIFAAFAAALAAMFLLEAMLCART
jgi:hypothetical protein